MRNLIRLKQIDVSEISGVFLEFLSEEYRTGVLADLISANAIFKTGDQTISGAKNFTIRPTVNFVPMLISGDQGNVISFDYESYPYKDVDSAIKALFDKALYEEPVMALTNTSGIVEKGITGTSITLDWTLNAGFITGQSLTDTGNLNTGVRTITFTGLNLTSDKTYFLNYGDSRTNKTTSTTFGFRQKRYWGVNPSTTLNNADILGLGNNEFATTRLQERFFNPGGSYIYFAYPASFGEATFRVNGLNNSAWIKTEINFENSSNFSETYFIYRSQFLQYGEDIRVEVV